jgi:hypothetical protein
LFIKNGCHVTIEVVLAVIHQKDSVHRQRYQENAEKVNGENQETPRI